jgi:hypothetical protein
MSYSCITEGLLISGEGMKNEGLLTLKVEGLKRCHQSHAKGLKKDIYNRKRISITPVIFSALLV